MEIAANKRVSASPATRGFIFPRFAYTLVNIMRPAKYLLLLFLLVPLVEIYILIKVGGLIGAIPTVFMVVFTAVLGALLLQAQGISTLRRFQETVARGQVPALEMLEGLFLLIGGVLLLTPGFFTDAFGFACLITPLRRWMVRRMIDRFQVFPNGGVYPPGAPPPRGEHEPRTLEGEYWKDDK